MQILKVSPIRMIKDDLENFSALGTGSFNFWNNEKDDEYQEFYKNKK